MIRHGSTVAVPGAPVQTIPETRPCLECGRPLTHAAHLEDNVNGTKSRELFLCTGHPPTVFRRWQGILARGERCDRCGSRCTDANDCDVLLTDRLLDHRD